MNYEYDDKYSYKIIVYPIKVEKQDHDLFINFYKIRTKMKKIKSNLPYTEGGIDAVSYFMQTNRQNKIDITNWYKRIAFKYNLDYRNLVYNPKKKVLFRIVLTNLDRD
jgi:hypothetical protein